MFPPQSKYKSHFVNLEHYVDFSGKVEIKFYTLSLSYIEFY